MTTQYLLGCDCGKKVRVEAAQAGQMVRCKCGEPLEVPTIRGLARLERIESKSADEPRRGWKMRDGAAFLGVVFIVAAVVAAITLHVVRYNQLSKARADLYPLESIRHAVEEFPLGHTWEEWIRLRDGFQPVNYTPEMLREQEDAVRAFIRSRYDPWIYVCYGLVVLGIAGTAGAWFWMSPRPRSAALRPGEKPQTAGGGSSPPQHRRKR